MWRVNIGLETDPNETKAARTAPVSIWRKLFAVNEWNEIQVHFFLRGYVLY